MAELSLSQLIQESLQNDYLIEKEEEEKSAEPSFFSKVNTSWKDTGKKLGQKIYGKMPEDMNDSEKAIANPTIRQKLGQFVMKHPRSTTGALAAGGLTAAGVGAAYLHHRSKNKGILNKIKNNPGKAAGVSLAALGAGAGALALMRYLRKKRKHQ